MSAVGLGVASVGALLTEFSGVAGVGELYGLPRYASLPVAAVALLVVVLTGSYRRVERLAIAVGLFELAFFFVAWAAHPDVGASAGRGGRYPVPQPRLPVSGGGEYRRGGDAVDGVLSAVRRCR